MRTNIDVELAKRAAKRLGRLPLFWETPHTERLAITAVVLGFEHWRSFAAYAAKHPADPLDETLDAGALVARRHAQAARLRAAVAQLDEARALSLITSWQPTSGHPNAALNALDDIKSVLRARDGFFEQGMHRAYLIFFDEMLGWPLTNINAAAKVREPIAFIGSDCFGLRFPLLAPAPQADNPTGFEPAYLRQLELDYPNGAIALLGEPLVDQTSDGQHWFTPGALVMDGQSTTITLRAGLERFDDLFEFRQDPDGYRLCRFADIGQWCAKTFAQCRHPKWQLDHGFDEGAE